LEHFSYDFKPATVTAVMGVTGAGKSTLTRLILALLHPSRGSIVLYSGDRSVPVSPSTRCNFRYVPQGNSLMSGTVRDNLLLANPSATEEEMKEALHLAVADFVLDLHDGLDTVCSEKGSGLSEGQAQRIAIARALLHPGGVLILDEATSALDRDTEDELLLRLSKKISGGKTILWITHRESVTSIADAVLRI
ncbi:MAG: ABC transporter ATP-binding protein, partial [Bacteroidales bacterium]|nr:ABC transporter ATP-binding protein [Bacteroidales bacterium]